MPNAPELLNLSAVDLTINANKAKMPNAPELLNLSAGTRLDCWFKEIFH
jgi:hypothetical protein